MKLQNTIIFFILLSFSITYTKAENLQNGKVVESQSITKESYDYANIVQLWKSGSNPARLSLDEFQERTMHYFNFSRKKGSYYLVQDGYAQNKLLFHSESYQKIGDYLYSYGHFIFDMGRQFNRSWSDVIRSHNSNPYFSGSAIRGNYAFQNFDLSASLATVPINNFTYGLSFDYKVGNLSRLRDPRSRTNLADYRIQPAITYSLGNNSFGLSVSYRRRKEKIPNFLTVQTDNSFKYYTFTGMENTIGITDGYGGFLRQFVNNVIEGELSYSFDSKSFTSLTAILFSKGNEKVNGKLKYSPGKYSTMKFAIKSKNLLKNDSKIHSLTFAANYEEGRADEYKQKEITEVNSENGVTSVYWKTILTYPNRYHVNLMDFNIYYRLNFIDKSRKESLAYVGIGGKYENVENKHILPYSALKYSWANLKLDGGLNLLRKNFHSLWVEAQFTYQNSLSSSLELTQSDSEYAVNVLKPDMKYYGASFLKGDISLEYQFPINLKTMKLNTYLRPNVSYLSTNKNTNFSCYSITIGVRY